MRKARKFCLGDVHGGAKALLVLLKEVKFDYELDTLIALGDLCDGWSQSRQVLNILMQIKNLVLIKGNHDQKVIDYYTGVMKPTKQNAWLRYEGGKETVKSLGEYIDSKYLTFLQSAKDYYIDNNRLFVHAGFDVKIPFLFNTSKQFRHDRNMVMLAYESRKTHSRITHEFDQVYVGHVCLHHIDDDLTMPQHWTNVWCMDTGAGFEGRLSMMDVDSGEIFQSEPVLTLYPTEKGRNGITYLGILEEDYLESVKSAKA